MQLSSLQADYQRALHCLEVQVCSYKSRYYASPRILGRRGPNNVAADACRLVECPAVSFTARRGEGHKLNKIKTISALLAERISRRGAVTAHILGSPRTITDRYVVVHAATASHRMTCRPLPRVRSCGAHTSEGQAVDVAAEGGAP